MEKLFRPTVLRQCSRTGEWFLMNRQDKGWSSFAYGPYVALDDVREEWDVTIGDAGEDAFGTFRHVVPRVTAVAQEGSWLK